MAFSRLGAAAALGAAVIAFAACAGSGSEGDFEAGGCVHTEAAPQGDDHVEHSPDLESYNTFPPTSGEHHPLPVIWNVYDAPVEQFRLVHNLEHGGVAVQYGDAVSAEDVEAIVAWYMGSPDAVVVAPLPELGGDIALTAWMSLLTCSSGFDEAAFTAFRDAYLFKGPESLAVETYSPRAPVGDIVAVVRGDSEPLVDSSRVALSERVALVNDLENADAQLELARTLVANGHMRDAIVAYARYLELVPRDIDALVQLGALYMNSATTYASEAVALQAESDDDLFGSDFAPQGELGDALGSDPIVDAAVEEAADALAEAIRVARDEYANAADVYLQLSELRPDNPIYLLQLGQASKPAGDLEGAIAAYERFLALFPDDGNAPLAERELDELQAAASP